MRKNLAENDVSVDGARKYFAALLWRAFPSASENELTQKAATVLDVSPRQIKNWLRCENSAAWHYVAKVMAIAGVEMVIRGRD
ncbi:hypothetical protein KUW09_04735 [Mameliella alba]|nr:hypothetical protein [Antarctobacter heliothermus]MBY6143334.1 hypothetical protein [Mameliella alba]MBY6163993.1 hypothetical protein [Mameliella alba]MBY6172465.1 hypothetical protein [Mameliella alba]MBY6177479.1 hypothetical protein [Mameliella alba]